MNVKNLNLSVEELKILAENGQRDFIYGVGYYYENGIRTSIDLVQAAVWYEKAAKKGQAEAAMHLALMYFQGKGVEKDERKNCAVCSGTGFTLCLACMGGGLIDTNAYA